MLTKNLEIELKALAKELLKKEDSFSSEEVFEKIRSLYEKSLVLRYALEHEFDLSEDEDKKAIVVKFEKMAEQVLSTRKEIPENNPHQDDIMIPGMLTIKDMVSQMGDQIVNETIAPNPTLTLNDQLSKGLKLGLNDRLAFTKHLFGGQNEDLDRVLTTLASIDNLDEAIDFINHYVKPEYTNWEGKEEYEERFLNLIRSQYS
jgi:hypothetical protein